MITATVLALALTLQALSPPPAQAVSFAECQAWLCLPGDFPPSECSPAKAAVLNRLAHFKPALPPWSSCASAFGWDAASLGHTDDWHDECPHGGSPDRPGINATTCTGKDSEGCDFSYSAQKKVSVQVAVDGSTGFAPNNILTHAVTPAGSLTVDAASCHTPPPVAGGGGSGHDVGGFAPADGGIGLGGGGGGTGGVARAAALAFLAGQGLRERSYRRQTVKEC